MGVFRQPPQPAVRLPLIPQGLNQGPVNAGAGSDDNSIGTAAWSNPGNITSPDDIYATVTLGVGVTSHYLKATNFVFSPPIPGNSTIVGVEAGIERSTSSGAGRDGSVKLVKGGTAQGTEMAMPGDWPGTDAEALYGGLTNSWGVPLTPQDVNATDFGFAVAAQDSGGAGAAARVDRMRLTVYYDLLPPDDPPPGYKSTPLSVSSSWRPLSPQPRQARNLPADVTAVPADAPPFGVPAPALPAILAAWRPDQFPQRQQTRRTVPDELQVNDPPFAQRVPLPSILKAWEYVQPQRERHGTFLPPADAVDDPPPLQRGWLPAVLLSWVVPPPLRHEPDQRVVDGTVAAESPAWRGPAFWSVLASWNVPPPQPQQRASGVVQDGAVVADEVPGGRNQQALAAVLRAWEATVPPRPARIVRPPSPRSSSLARPFLTYLPDNDARLRRFTELISAIVNSLFGKHQLIQNGVLDFEVRGGGFGEERDPAATDDASQGANVGTIWVNTLTGKVFVCQSVAPAGAAWVPLN